MRYAQMMQLYGMTNSFQAGVKQAKSVLPTVKHQVPHELEV